MELKGVTVLVIIVAMCALVAPAAAQPTPSTPFLISGWVNYSNGAPVNNPTVSINNTNTSEVFTAETNESYNYYQTVTSSDNVSMGNILNFNASNGNVNEFNRNVTEDEINSSGGFVQNITISGLANHVVISEIQAYNESDKDDWIELYNPTSQSIDLAAGGYRIEKTVTATNPSIVMVIGDLGDGSYPGGTIIPTHGFYLIVHDEANQSLKDKADAIGNRSEFTWTGTGYTLYLGTAAITSDDDPDIVDKVGFGSGATYYETAPAPEIPNGESLQRKVNATINESTSYGPAWDTNNNSADFFIQTTPGPQNSSYTDVYGPVPPIPELPTLILFSSGLIILACYVLLKRRR